MVLNDYRLRPDFVLTHQVTDLMCQLLCQNGEVTSQVCQKKPEGVPCWYRMLEEDLPEEMADGEGEEWRNT